MRTCVVQLALVLGLLGVALAASGGGAAATLPAPSLAPPQSRVSRVLVYSGQAQVFRVASVTIGALAQEVAVADLPRSVVPDTVKVECKSAEVVRVEVSRTRANLPRQVKAKELLGKVEAALSALQAVADERAVLRGEIDYLASLGVQTLPVPRDGKLAGEGLFADAWRRILSWADGRAGKARARLLALAALEQQHRRALHGLKVEAQGLDLGASGEPVLRVRATLRGAGKHQVTVSYLIANARWTPAYDLGYDHRSRTVDATYYAAVSQSSGEDWDNAVLEFSTGTPTHLVAVPELPTWTLGRKRDFTPTPRLRPEPRAASWSPPPRSETVEPVLEELLRALAEGDRPAAPSSAHSSATPPDSGPTGSSKTTRYEFQDDTVESILPKPAAQDLRALPRAPAPPSPPREAGMAATPRASMPAAAPALAPSADVAEKQSFSPLSSTGRRSVSIPTEDLPWTDEGYAPPAMDPNSPAAGAEGYLFTLYAPGRHTIPATGAARRIPLLRRRLAVSPVYRVRAGVSPAAYLMASVENVTGQPILRGPANLFAGAMFAGSSWINMALPGRKLVLPLGVDDAIKVVRHIRQQTALEGVVFKDDVTEYTVDIEVANHRRYPIAIEVEDQVPLTQGKKIDVRGFSSESFGPPDKDTGKLRWQGTIGSSTVKKLSFSFKIQRPKNWDLSQQDG